MRLILLPAGLLLGLLSVCAQAQGFVDSRGLAPPPPPLSATIDPDRAAAIARAQTGGRVLDVRPVPNGGRESFAVRLLLDAGRVRTVVIDGQSGQLR
jgi:uncharacterized membrane protein YkoI